MAARAVAALAAGDLARLDADMTAAGQARIRADLDAFAASLRGPAHATATIRERARALFSGEAERLIEVAASAPPEDRLRFLRRLDPLPAEATLRVDRQAEREAVVLYETATGVERPVRLIRTTTGWWIDALAL